MLLKTKPVKKKTISSLFFYVNKYEKKYFIQIHFSNFNR